MADHATTGDAINRVVDKATEAVKVLASAAPKVTEVTLTTVRAEAATNVVYGAEGLISIFVLILLWRKYYSPWVKKHEYDCDGDLLILIAGGIQIALIGICLVLVLNTIFDPWTYIAMFHPDMYLAHKVLAKLGE